VVYSLDTLPVLFEIFCVFTRNKKTGDRDHKVAGGIVTGWNDNRERACRSDKNVRTVQIGTTSNRRNWTGLCGTRVPEIATAYIAPVFPSQGHIILVPKLVSSNLS
jgi:hypothetical protein